MDQIGTYRVVRQLGQGGMGVVYEAMNDQISRRVAIKVLHKEVSANPDLLARFFNEARASNLASHASIVDVYELGQLPDGRAYIVMQFLAGHSLADRLQQRGGRLPAADAIRLIRQVASGMAAAHKKGIVHRDLKPDNVMIVEDSEAPGGERAKIVDFGIAKMLEAAEDPRQPRRTRAGTVLGTPAYMAPEQCRGAEGLTEKADVYALGVMLYECLSGRTPFLASGTGEMLAMHIYEQPPPLWELDSSLSADLVALVHAMLHKQPESRPAMIEVAARLAKLGAPQSTDSLPQHVPAGEGAVPPRTPVRVTEALEPSPEDARPNSGTRPAGYGPAPKRTRWLALGGALSCVLLLGVGSQMWRKSKQSQPPLPVDRTVPSVDAAMRRASAGAGPTDKPSQAAAVHWSIASQPPGAQVVDIVSQQVLGMTPFETDRTTGSGQRALLLRLAGYQEHALQLLEDRNESRRVNLVPIVPVARPSEPPTTDKPTKPKRAAKPAKPTTHAGAGKPMSDDDVRVVK